MTVQAGARIQDVVEQLRPHGLTLQNFASIREQSVGGFTQVLLTWGLAETLNPDTVVTSAAASPTVNNPLSVQSQALRCAVASCQALQLALPEV